MTKTPYDLDHIFRYHAPEGNDLAKYGRIREAAKLFARVILDNTVEGEDQDIAIHLIRNTTMIANASIALKGRLRK